MSQFRSNFSKMIERFIKYRKASGSWNEPCYGLNIKLFDHFCADNYPLDVTLTQEMVTAWCAKRDTETNCSYDTRTRVVRMFIDYLQCRELTDVFPPAVLRPEPRKYTPYAFEEDELKHFFYVCDSIQPYLGRRASLIRKFTVPVFFRFLYSTGMRTTEARLLRTEDVDLRRGVINIQKSKGYNQHYVVMHNTMANLMARYDRAIAELQPFRIYFFQSYKGSHYSRDWVQDNFRTLWNKANDPAASPVAYDLRHVYSVHCLKKWSEQGKDLMVYLPILRTYLGHDSFEETAYYLRLTADVFPEITLKLETMYPDLVPVLELGGGTYETD